MLTLAEGVSGRMKRLGQVGLMLWMGIGTLGAIQIQDEPPPGVTVLIPEVGAPLAYGEGGFAETSEPQAAEQQASGQSGDAQAARQPAGFLVDLVELAASNAGLPARIHLVPPRDDAGDGGAELEREPAAENFVIRISGESFGNQGASLQVSQAPLSVHPTAFIVPLETPAVSYLSDMKGWKVGITPDHGLPENAPSAVEMRAPDLDHSDSSLSSSLWIADTSLETVPPQDSPRQQFPAQLAFEIPDVEVVWTSGIDEALKLCLEGRLDAVAYSHPFAESVLNRYIAANLKIAYLHHGTGAFAFVTEFSGQDSMAARLDRSLRNIPEETHAELLENWRISGSGIPGNQFLNFSAEDYAWLARHSGLRAAFKPIPDSFSSKETHPILGTAQDYLNLLEQSLGHQFNRLPSPENIEADILLGVPQIGSRPENTAPFTFRTRPYLSLPAVVLTPDSRQFITDYHISSDTAVIPDPLWRSELLRAYPHLEPVEVESSGQARRYLKNGTAEMMITDYLSGGFFLHGRIRQDIKINGELGIKMELTAEVHPRRAELLPLLNRAIASIPDTRHTKILGRWNYAGAPSALNWKDIIPFFLAGSAVLAAFWLWNLRLNKEIQKRKKSERVLLEKREATFESERHDATSSLISSLTAKMIPLMRHHLTQAQDATASLRVMEKEFFQGTPSQPNTLRLLETTCVSYEKLIAELREFADLIGKLKILSSVDEPERIRSYDFPEYLRDILTGRHKILAQGSLLVTTECSIPFTFAVQQGLFMEIMDRLLSAALSCTSEEDPAELHMALSKEGKYLYIICSGRIAEQMPFGSELDYKILTALVTDILNGRLQLKIPSEGPVQLILKIPELPSWTNGR